MTIRLRAFPGVVDFDDGTHYENDPGITIYVPLLRSATWLSLNSCERGQLVTLWVISSDSDGVISDDPNYLENVCGSDNPVDLSRFIKLGLIEKID